MIEATKNKAKSWSFLVAIPRCLCGRSAVWLKIDGRDIPVSRSTLEKLQTGRYATVRFATPSSSHLHFEALLSLLGSLRKPLKTKFTTAVSSVDSLSLSLSLSLRVSTLEKNHQSRLSTVDPSKTVRKASVPSLFFLLWTSRSTCGSRTACWMRTAPVLRLWDRERSSGSALTGLLQQTSLNVGYQIQVSRAHTAGSG